MLESFAWTWDGTRDCSAGRKQCLFFSWLDNLHAPISTAARARTMRAGQLVALRAFDQIG